LAHSWPTSSAGCEEQASTTIERAWLDTTRPEFGKTYTLGIQLQDYRGNRRTLTQPVTMPLQATGPLTLVVSDGPTLAQTEQRDLRPGKPTSYAELLRVVGDTRRNNRLYVRLIATTAGTVLGGDTMPSLPATMQSALQADATASRAAVSKTVVGAWEQRLDMAIKGSREIPITLSPAR
jgi:hypothetical protein